MTLSQSLLQRATRGEPQVAGWFGTWDEEWTPEDDARLLDMHRRGLSMKNAARQLGRTANACSIRLCRLAKGRK